MCSEVKIGIFAMEFAFILCLSCILLVETYVMRHKTWLDMGMHVMHISLGGKYYRRVKFWNQQQHQIVVKVCISYVYSVEFMAAFIHLDVVKLKRLSTRANHRAASRNALFGSRSNLTAWDFHYTIQEEGMT
jgi:hypothetical protein